MFYLCMLIHSVSNLIGFEEALILWKTVLEQLY